MAIKPLRGSALALAASVAATAACAPSASALEFTEVELTLNLETQTSESQVTLPGRDFSVQLRSASDITDREFVDLDLRIIVDAETAPQIMKRLDQGFTSEDSGCDPTYYGPLAMEEGLKYFFDLTLLSNEPIAERENVRGTIYPGDRSTHWANDVFCEYDAELGDDYAVLRFSGYFFVIHSKLKDAVDIQLRPLTLTDAQIDALVVDRPAP